MNDSTNKKIGLWVYFIFFFAGILSFPIAFLLFGPGNNIILESPWISRDLKDYLSFFYMLLLPLFICSIFFAIGMYFFKTKSYIYIIKAFFGSFVASSLITISGFYIFPFLLPLLIFVTILIFSGKYPDYRLPINAFISSFIIPLIIIITFVTIIFGINSRLFPEPATQYIEPISIPEKNVLNGEVLNLGQPVTRPGIVRILALATGLDGNIYGGTEMGTFFIYDPNTTISKPIENIFNEDSIYSLAVGENGLVYGGTGMNAKLFVYDPFNQSISYLGQPIDNGRIICSLVVLESDVYGSTCDMYAYANSTKSHLFVYNSTVGNFTDLGQPVEGETSSKIISGKNGKIYGGTYPNGYLFSYDPGNKSYSIISKPINGEATAFPLIMGKDDRIYISLNESLYVFDPINSTIDKLYSLGDLFPRKGEYFVSLTAGMEGNIYGGTEPHGFLFVYNTSGSAGYKSVLWPDGTYHQERQTITTSNSVTFGKPIEYQDMITSLTTSLNGKIYGGTGWEGAYLFSYDPNNNTSPK